MATFADQIISIQTQLTALEASVAAIATPTVDLTAITTEIAGVQTTANAILAQLEPTPPAA